MARYCSIPDCIRSFYARGFCIVHYQRWRRYGDPLFLAIRFTCSVVGCARKHAAKGLCGMHYQRQYKGNEVGGPESLKGPDVRRLLKRLKVMENDCWLYTGKLTRKGYAHVQFGGRMQFAHRIIFEHYVGPIPKNLEPDHKCRMRHCCNPDHLELVTHKINVQRGLAGINWKTNHRDPITKKWISKKDERMNHGSNSEG